MSINDGSVDYFAFNGGVVTIGVNGSASTTSLNIVDLSALSTEYGSSLDAADPNNDQVINVGEEFILTDYNIFGTPTGTTTLTLQGSGTYTTLTGTRTVIIGVDSGGNQYIVFPDGDAPLLTGALIAETVIYGIGYNYATMDVNCFASGTLIETDHGDVPVEFLRVGDLVRTMDHGFRAIRWIGGRRISEEELFRSPNLRPVRIKAGALGEGLPRRDLLVSRQHRVLARSTIAMKMFGMHEILIGAIHLTGIEGIDVAEDVNSVSYWHILFDGHEIVFSDGAATESLFAGPQALSSLSMQSYVEILGLFPELTNSNAPNPARDMVKGRKARNFVSRIAKNGKSIIAPAIPRLALT